MSLRDKFNRYDKEYSMGGDFFKFPEGETKLRILAEPELYADEYKGQKKGTWITYALVRNDEEGDKIFTVNLPVAVARWLMDQEELDKFKGWPMPFDVMIFRTGSGKGSKYAPMPMPAQMSPELSAEQRAEMAELKPLPELAGRLEQKKAENSERSTQARVPSETQVKRNHAEVNPMFTALQKSIENATGGTTLDKAIEMITVCISSGSINEFEADLLREQIKNQLATDFGRRVPKVASTDDINVEDIPF